MGFPIWFWLDSARSGKDQIESDIQLEARKYAKNCPAKFVVKYCPHCRNYMIREEGAYCKKHKAFM